jgi:serine/threonine protein kinase/tetratricopeptide (TPR) repeat protein
MLTSESWQRARDVLHAAMQIDEADRSAFLDSRCAGDPSLRAELNELLAAEGEITSGFLESRAVVYAASGTVTSDHTSFLPPGTPLGPYVVQSRIGAGGMGEVYRARDSRLGRMVAIKVMRYGLSADEPSRKRFVREARAIAALNHPGIAALYDAGEAGDGLYLAMEYLEGPTLQQEIGHGPISSSTLKEYSLQIAAALEHAHARGIIHRDIKPANIIVTRNGVLKLLDFGLARNTAPTEETPSMVTGAGAIVGTLQYCAPEVLAGRPATIRSDIYSLGVAMYEMACGCVPLAGLDTPSLIAAALGGQIPPVRQRNPALSEALGVVIGRAMALAPQDRFQSAAELAAALRSKGGHPNKSAIFIERAAPVIAVLDFDNLSGDSETEWLGIGIAETICADLRKLGKVQLVSRDRVQMELRRFVDSKDMAALGAQLKARWLVTGSYQRAGDRIRITPKLLEPISGEAITVGKIDGAWDEIFDLQDRVVSEIMQSLELEMDSGARKRIAAPETLRLEAYEQYVQGLKNYQALGKDSIEAARKHYARAIELDPDYAVAYAGLGQAYAMRWIHRNDPDDLARASGCLERALELDPELGAPYGILCYVYIRQNKLEKAIDAGVKSVHHNPDAYLPHYYLAAAYWIASQGMTSYLQNAVDHFLISIQIEPLMSASWLNLGAIAMETSAYDRAEQLIAEVLELQRSKRGISRLPFGEMILAAVAMRRLDWENALEWHERGLQHLAQVDSVYSETAIALNACGMADVRLRQNEPDRALADLHRAWRIAGEYPRMMAHNRVLARAAAGMASAYAALGERGRAEQFVNDAASRLEIVYQNRGGLIHGVATSELCRALAVAQIRLGNLDAASALLTKAVEEGERDWRWVQSDPELAPVRENVDSIIEGMRQFKELRFSDNSKVPTLQ